MEKTRYKKVAVFDFDDTLCDGNSHLMILKSYYGTKFYESLFMKAVGKILKKTYQKILDERMKKIPAEFVKEYKFPIKKTAYNYLSEKRMQDYHCIVISFAPIQIIEAIKVQLAVDAYQSPRGEKKRVLDEIAVYDQLFVCTDNIEDCCLLDAAEQKVIYVTKTTKNFFSNKYPDAIIMEEKKL